MGEQDRDARPRSRRCWSTVAVTVAAIAVAAPSVCAAAAAPIPSAHLAGPVAGGVHARPFGSSVVDLRPWDYREDEYFASGVAQPGGSTAIPTPSTGSRPARYTTRLVVRRPADSTRFNGTVLVEWFNVSSSHDYDADWSEGYREILRGGYAYVGVSAQQIGMNSTKNWDPVRYAALQHPGDNYAASIYAQILTAVRRPDGADPFTGLQVRRVIADGHSQSGINLHAFVDTVQDATPVADGFLIRGDADTTFDIAHLRTPVLQYQSEAELAGPIGRLQQGGKYRPPEPDSAYYRLWQVAGSTHTSQEGGDYLFASLGRDYVTNQPPAWDEATEGRYEGSGTRSCPSSIGVGTLDQFPQWYTLDAAIRALDRWLKTGRAPTPAPRIETDPSGAIQRDSHGNAVGGVRNPVVDVPVATYHGDEGCPLSGTTVAFDEATMRALYADHASYVHKMRRATKRAVSAGWLLDYDAADLLARAARLAGG